MIFILMFMFVKMTFLGAKAKVSLVEKLYQCYCDDCDDNHICFTDSYCYASVIISKIPTEPPMAIKRACVPPNGEAAVVALFCRYNLADINVYTRCCRNDQTELCNSETNMPLQNILASEEFIKYGKLTQFTRGPASWKFILLMVTIVTIVLLLSCAGIFKRFVINTENSEPWKCLICRYIKKKFKKSLHQVEATTSNTDNNDSNSALHLNENEAVIENSIDRNLSTGTSSHHTKNSNNSSLIDCESCCTKITDNCSILTNSSGSGHPILLESRISSQIKLNNLIGTGKFGKVYSGIWKINPVVVKVITDTESALHEAAIYYNYHLRHENVLCFISMDYCSDKGPQEYWLVFDFHPKGSIYDYLAGCFHHQYNFVRENDIFHLKQILVSICAGLSYLHSEIIGHGTMKPRIAHRDIKTKNILLKNDGQCCIADLGMSVVESTDQIPNKNLIKQSNIGNHSKESQRFLHENMNSNNDQILRLSSYISFHNVVGTRRYMAPEIISFNLHLNAINSVLSFSDFLKADIYSFGFVMWEILRCYTINEGSGSYYDHLEPYGDIIQSQPTLKQLFPIVCEQKLRPVLCAEWEHSVVAKDLLDLITSCWHHDPNVRPRIFYVFKKLDRIFEKITFPSNSTH